MNANALMALRELAFEAHRVAREKGWWRPYEAPFDGGHQGEQRAPQGVMPLLIIPPDAILAKLMLCVSELAEACEIARMPGVDLRAVWPAGQVGTPYVEYMHATPSSTLKPEGFGIEMMDVAIRIVDLCEALGIDVERAYRLKSVYNESRPDRHGGKLA
jgi:hypothetical protein